MAQNKSILLAFILIFFIGFSSIQARTLKSSSEAIQVAHQPLGEAVAATPELVPPPPPSHDVNDFRPTAPGHSPGVGHSVHN
ncbi:hypothetical protein HN51_006762 [Arachis hypogaea]|uniref:Uncharacterized protein n=1 Tax=Arachis hypogaea TaxID=3818 RepID=A0A444WT05_ARAHY|nr:uncharacterized protein DS421_5g139840 [Arachis hypogaea]RYQ80578.1 hypothetical protein Ahy_Scaffold1g106896 [Arachis hypogaea]